MADLLEGRFAKISRAGELLADLDRFIQTYFQQDPPPYEVSKGVIDSDPEYSFKVRGTS